MPLGQVIYKSGIALFMGGESTPSRAVVKKEYDRLLPSAVTP